ncbi:VPLPA-CTERM sorting domain-containing protein [Rhodovulum marinum]|uniref:Putative secreted protein n=1 Tax=Rhodovulum marinum TaxID=320662 RepID=A0A4R2PW98_9RHOB|nr:VPLPA-CTERM sorting domain-containing protein [Rhodovulum marinum]TCP39544.1 putative secreted protein [Rhodovulum marinum]
MDMKILAAAASGALLLGVGQAAAATIVIDSFVTDQQVGDADALPSLAQGSELAAADAVGGWRDMYVVSSGTAISATGLVAGIPDGVLAFNNADNVTGQAWVTYDGNDGDAIAVDNLGLNLDLGGQPGSGFQFQVLRLDQGALSAEIRVWDRTGAFTSFGGPISPGGDTFVPFALFDNAAFDWTQVGAIQFYAETTGAISVDAAIGPITVETVPLPASALLLLGGLGGLSAVGMRRRKRS